MARLDRGFVLASAFTAALVLLVSTAISEQPDFLSGAVTLSCIGAAVFFYLLFPGSRAFAVGLANGLAVYACLFAFFIETNFDDISHWARPLGFVLPVITFLLGAALRRRMIQAIVVSDQPRQTLHIGRLLFWTVPLMVIGAGTYLLPARMDAGTADLAFLGSMALVASVSGLLSTSIAIFLLDSSLLFEAFFKRLGQMAIAAFAFLTFYSLLVILFGVTYRLLSRYSPETHFLINGVERDLTFPDALYFSLVTLATVGFGDIVPLSAAARILVAGEIVTGVLLLLFGFAEIMHAAQERDRRGRQR